MEDESRKVVTLDDIERRNVAKHGEKLYAWIKHVVSLAATTLTALVALQKYYISDNPSGLFLLQGCWLALALSITLGVVALYGESQTLLDSVVHLRRIRIEHGDEYAAQYVNSGKAVYPKKIFSISVKVLPYCFSGALFSLALFAAINL